MKRYLIVYIVASGDPGTAYVWGTSIGNALTIWESGYSKASGPPDVLSVVKVQERKDRDG